MRIEDVWRQLEAEARAGTASAWLMRFALPSPAQPLLVALETSCNRRALLLQLPKVAIPARRHWPQCRGLEIFSAVIGGQPHLGVRLLDPLFEDVFAALAEDVAPRVAAATQPKAASGALLSRLERWQKFLAAGKIGLSVERWRGLYGELQTLRKHLIPALGAKLSVQGWKAPQAAHQDFQFTSGALEVKTSVAKQPQSIRITSERQLDDTGISALFLHVVILDERETEGNGATADESLPELVRDLRQKVSCDQSALELFEDSLLAAGYLEADAGRYETRRFALRREHTFRVRPGFPRLLESDLPTGIGDVSYGLSLAACKPFCIVLGEMITVLQATPRRID